MFIVYSYDIPDDRRRNVIMKIAKDYGRRVQYSVFECLLQEEKLSEMVQRTKEAIEPAEDSIRIYRLCEACCKKIEVHGLGGITEDEDVYIV